MHSCTAPVCAETTMRVSTQARHGSSARSRGSMICMRLPSRLDQPDVREQMQRSGASELLHKGRTPMTSTTSKVALVTGAARGIGLATAKRFLAEGWRVALLDIEAELLKGAVADIADPDHTLALPCDVSDAKG